MAQALEALPQAVLIADSSGRILARNAAARDSLPIGERLPAAREPAEGTLVNWHVQLAALADGALQGLDWLARAAPRLADVIVLAGPPRRSARAAS